jgi:hypothetical protein
MVKIKREIKHAFLLLMTFSFLLAPRCIYGVKERGIACRVKLEENADESGETEGEDYRNKGDNCGPARDRRYYHIVSFLSSEGAKRINNALSRSKILPLVLPYPPYMFMICSVHSSLRILPSRNFLVLP